MLRVQEIASSTLAQTLLCFSAKKRKGLLSNQANQPNQFNQRLRQCGHHDYNTSIVLYVIALI